MKQTLIITILLGTFASAGAGLPTPSEIFEEAPVPVVGADIDALLEIVAEAKPSVEHVRFFRHDELDEQLHGAQADIRRESGLFSPRTRTLVVVGALYGESLIEDIRAVQTDGETHVLRDIYLGGTEEFPGRAAPVLLSSTGPRTQAPTITITTITGANVPAAGVQNGVVSPVLVTCGTHYNNFRAVNDQPGTYPWTINGTFPLSPSPPTVQVAGFPASVSSYSQSRIVATPTIPIYYGAMSTMLRVAYGSASATYDVPIAPAIRSRVYGQCTHLVALMRLNMGKQPSPSAYLGYQQITGWWIPQVGDQLQWNGIHTAIIVAVSGPLTSRPGYTLYRVMIYERNADCQNSLHSYSSDFEVMNATHTVTQWLQSSAGLGKATLFYR